MIRSMTGFAEAALEQAELRASVSVRALNHRFFDLTLHLLPVGQAYQETWRYAPSLYDRRTVQALAAGYRRTVAAAVSNPEIPVGELAAIAAAARGEHSG